MRLRPRRSVKCAVCAGSIEPGPASEADFDKGIWKHLSCAALDAPPELDDDMPVPVPAPAPQPHHLPPKPVEPGAITLSFDGKVLAELVEPHLRRGVDEATLQRIVDEAVAKAKFPREVVLKRPDAPDIKLPPSAHPETVRLAKRLNVKDPRTKYPQPCYLWGPPGWGKTYSAMLMAKMLGVPFYLIQLSKIDGPARLLGCPSVQPGQFTISEYAKAYVEGGLVLLDESDGFNQSVLNSTTASLAGDYGSFAHGTFKRSEDFYVIGAGNTPGLGPTAQFQHREPMDFAFRDRFAFIHWYEHPPMELEIAASYGAVGTTWCGWVQRVREVARKLAPNLVVSPRSTYAGAHILTTDEDVPLELVAEEVIYKGGVKPETIKQLHAEAAFPAQLAPGKRTALYGRA